MSKCTDSTPKMVSGSKIILFLGKADNQSGFETWSAIGAVWIEQGVAYGLYDGKRAWEGTFTKVGTETSVRETIDKVVSEKAGS